MAKITRKSAKIFAEGANAAVGGIAQFGSLAAGTPNYSKDPDVIQSLGQYSQGWSAAVLGTKSPALEDRNALDFLLSYQQAYIMQRGIPEWLDTETYYQGSFASKSNGALYVSKVDNNTNHDPETDTSETYWIKFPTPAEVAATYVKKAGDTMTGDLKIQNTVASLFLIDSNNYGYRLSKNGVGDLMLLNTSQSKGLRLNSSDNSIPYYYDGLNSYRLLDTRDIQNMLRRPNYSAGIEGSVVSPSSTYTCPSKGYLFLKSANTNGVQAAINGISVAISESDEHGGTNPTINLMIPVSQGDILSVVGTVTGRTIYFSFCPEENNI